MDDNVIILPAIFAILSRRPQDGCWPLESTSEMFREFGQLNFSFTYTCMLVLHIKHRPRHHSNNSCSMSTSSDNGVCAERLDLAVELNERTCEYVGSDEFTTCRYHIDMERMTQRLVTHPRYRKIRKISIIFDDKRPAYCNVVSTPPPQSCDEPASSDQPE